MAVRQGPKDNQIGAEVKAEIFTMDSEAEVEILLAAGEETHGFQKEEEEGMQEEGPVDHLIHLDVMCAGCVAIWPVTVPNAQQLLKRVVIPILEIHPDMCKETHPIIGLEEGVFVSAD